MKALLTISQEFDTFKCEACEVEFMWFAVIRLDEQDNVERVNIWSTAKAVACPACGHHFNPTQWAEE